MGPVGESFAMELEFWHILVLFGMWLAYDLYRSRRQEARAPLELIRDAQDPVKAVEALQYMENIRAHEKVVAQMKRTAEEAAKKAPAVPPIVIDGEEFFPVQSPDDLLSPKDF